MVTVRNDSCEPEAVLLRLFRCMTDSEREEMVPAALQILAKRCSLDPQYQHLSAEDLRLELEGVKHEENVEQDPDLDGRLMAVWAAGWPGRQIVDLDYVGDPGTWLSEKLGKPMLQVLFGWAWDDEANASMLAEEYLRAICELGYPLPSDYDDEIESPGEGWSDEDEKMVQAEFLAFLQYWRQRIVETIEKQNKPAGGEHG